jgi:hypothetical protein
MKPFAVIAIYAATGVAAVSSPKYNSRTPNFHQRG